MKTREQTAQWRRAESSETENAPAPNLYDKLKDRKNLEAGYKTTQQGKKKFRSESVLYDACAESNLDKLEESLENRTYKLGKYRTMIVREPKERIVHYPALPDKIVQYSAHMIFRELYEPVFIRDTYACIKGRGMHDAIRRIQHNMRICRWKHGDVWIVKIDLRKYFYSINREIVKKLYRKQIPEGDEFLWYLDMLLDHSPEPGGRGIPLGNTTSQDEANITGNEIDQFAKRFLCLKYYVRYMDDIIITVPSKAEARATLQSMVAFISEHLDLEVNEKTKIFPAKQGVKTLGVRIYETHILLQDATIQGMKRRIAEMDRKVKAGEMKEKDVQLAVNAWLGHARHTNSYNLCKKIFAPYPYIQIEDPEWKFGDWSKKKRKAYNEKMELKKLQKAARKETSR